MHLPMLSGHKLCPFLPLLSCMKRGLGLELHIAKGLVTHVHACSLECSCDDDDDDDDSFDDYLDFHSHTHIT